MPGARKEKGPQDMRAFMIFGGEEEDRTPDLRIANATLSQLSYPPEERRHYSPPGGPVGLQAMPLRRASSSQRPEWSASPWPCSAALA